MLVRDRNLTPNKYIATMGHQEELLVTTWVSRSVLKLLGLSWESEKRDPYIAYLTSTPESEVRRADVYRTNADPHYVTTDLVIQAGTIQEAVDKSMHAEMGGFLCAGFEPYEVQLVEMHAGLTLDLSTPDQPQPMDTYLDDKRFNVDPGLVYAGWDEVKKFYQAVA